MAGQKQKTVCHDCGREFLRLASHKCKGSVTPGTAPAEFDDPQKTRSEIFLVHLSDLRSSTLVFDQIPSGARPKASESLRRVVDLCVRRNDWESWKKLLTSAYHAMCYLDDCTLGGDVEVAISGIEKVMVVGDEYGLSHNMEKCEVLSVASRETGINEAWLQLSKKLPHMKSINQEDWSVLGSPLTDQGIQPGNFEKLLANASVLEYIAQFWGAVDRPSGAWLQALPVAPPDILMDRNTLRVAIALRLGANTCHPHQCLCGKDVDEKGRHGLSCFSSAGRNSRHASLNAIVHRYLIKAGHPSVLEPGGLSPTDEKRTHGITIHAWIQEKTWCGMPLAWIHSANLMLWPPLNGHLALLSRPKSRSQKNTIFYGIATFLSLWASKQAEYGAILLNSLFVSCLLSFEKTCVTTDRKSI